MKKLVTPLQIAMTAFFFVEIAAIAGAAAFPGVSLWLWARDSLDDGPLKILLLCMLAVLAYFLYGLGLLVALPIARMVTGARGTPLGRYPYVSWKGYQWASYNALILVMRYSFINWIRSTPFIVIFHRLMGMKAGARVQINTPVVADSNLITIGDDSVIGGDVTLVAHVVEGRELVTARVVIGRRVTVGLMAVVMPGCEIGDGAILAANAVLAKGTMVGPDEIWGGVPAKLIRKREPRDPAPAGRGPGVAATPDLV